MRPLARPLASAAPPPAGPGPGSRPAWLALAALAALVLGVYLAWGRSGFNYDDRVEFLRVTPPQSLPETLRLFGEPSYPGMPYYRPVTKALLLLQKSLSGAEPFPFHLANALLAVAAAWSAYALLRTPGFRLTRALAWLGGAIFALHPIAGSCVYPASGGRYSLLAAVFMIGALAAFLRPGRRAYALALVLFALALLSKEQAVVVLPLFVLADLLGVSAEPPGASATRWLRRYALPVALFAGYFAARAYVFRHDHFDLVLLPRPTVTLLTPLYALQSALAPTWELIYEPVRAASWLTPVRFAVALLAAAGGVVAACRHDSGAGKVIAFWTAWFVLGLLPSASLISQEVAFDERYTFMSLVAVVGIAGLALARAPRRPVLAIGGVALAGLIAITLNRGRYFENDLVFARQWVRTSPEEYLPHYSLGVVLAEHGQADAAMVAYRRALALNPEWPDAHMNLGALHLQHGEPREALARFLDYVRLKPRSAKAHYSAGVATLVLGNYPEAERWLNQALTLAPSPEAHHNLAVTLEQLARPAEAVAHYEAALRLDPAKRNSRENLDALRARLRP